MKERYILEIKIYSWKLAHSKEINYETKEDLIEAKETLEKVFWKWKGFGSNNIYLKARVEL